MRPLAVESLILTGGQCLTAFGSRFKTPGSKLTTNWIHAHKRTDLLTMAHITMLKAKCNTYLL